MLNLFDSLEHLEPKCPNCRIILDYGINTEYDNKKKGHVCLGCKSLIE